MPSNTWLDLLVAPKCAVRLSRRWYFKASWWRVPSFVVIVVVLVCCCRRLVGEVSCGRALPLGRVQERLQVLVKVCRVEEHRVRDASAGHRVVGGRNRSSLVKTCARKHFFHLFTSSPISVSTFDGSSLPCSSITILLDHFSLALFKSLSASFHGFDKNLSETKLATLVKIEINREWLKLNTFRNKQEPHDWQTSKPYQHCFTYLLSGGSFILSIYYYYLCSTSYCNWKQHM